MHPKNPHIAGYNFKALVSAHPPLQEYLHTNSFAKETVDFANPEAVFHINKALLKKHYGLKDWNFPEGYLCPPIPSRADYLLYINDLLKQKMLEEPIQILDIGTGANCIYPLLAATMLAWKAVGCDVDTKAVKAARSNVLYTEGLSKKIEIRQQPDPANIFKGILLPNEFYHATVCNPPFYTSEEEATKSTLRKLKNLHPEKSVMELERNFKGRPNELWCNGGEALFIKRMVKQSVAFQHQVYWFTTLVSKSETLPKLYKLLKKLNANFQTIEMQHGHKTTRVVAWQF